MVQYAEQKGLEDGSIAAPYSPPVRWTICVDADDAYISAYFHALAYVNNTFV